MSSSVNNRLITVLWDTETFQILPINPQWHVFRTTNISSTVGRSSPSTRNLTSKTTNWFAPEEAYNSYAQRMSEMDTILKGCFTLASGQGWWKLMYMTVHFVLPVDIMLLPTLIWFLDRLWCQYAQCLCVCARFWHPIVADWRLQNGQCLCQ